MIQRYFTYLLAVALFVVLIFNYKIVPDNISDRFLGVVKRNLKKERQELLEDMREITKQGLIHFEIYDETGHLITILKKPLDFEQEIVKKIDHKSFSIKSVSNPSLFGQIQLNSNLP